MCEARSKSVENLITLRYAKLPEKIWFSFMWKQNGNFSPFGNIINNAKKKYNYKCVMHLKFFPRNHIPFIRIPVFIGHESIAVLQCVREG